MVEDTIAKCEKIHDCSATSADCQPVLTVDLTSGRCIPRCNSLCQKQSIAFAEQDQSSVDFTVTSRAKDQGKLLPKKCSVPWS